MQLIFEVIKEYIDHQIKIRKKKVDFITNNYNLIKFRSKRDEMAQYITEIQELNMLLVEIGKLFNRVIEISK